VQAITARSILPIHDGYLSDHCALLVDFDSRIMFAGPTSEVVASHARKLTSTSPTAIERYMKSMMKQLTQHNVVQQVELLRLRSESGEWNDADTEKWETIDCTIAQARICAESSCSKKKSGQKPWSPELKRSGETLLYWRLRIQEYTSRRTNQQIQDELPALCNIPEDERVRLSLTELLLRI
jgi:hypothetical protein